LSEQTFIAFQRIIAAFGIVALTLAMAWIITSLERKAVAPYLPAYARRKAWGALSRGWLVRETLATSAYGWVMRLESNDRNREPFDLYLPADHPDLGDFRNLRRLDGIRLSFSVEPCCRAGTIDSGHHLRLVKESVSTWKMPALPANDRGSPA